MNIRFQILDFRLITAAAFSLLLVFFTGCPSLLSPTETSCMPGDVEYAKKTYSANLLFSEYEFVARSQAEFDALNTGVTLDPPVDFDTQMVVGVVDVLNDSCHGVDITGVETDCENVYVKVWKRTGSCPGEICLTYIWTACVTAVIDKTDLPVSFSYEYYQCP